MGTLLGDGCLAKHGRYHRLFVKHQLAQQSLVKFKYETFSNFITMPLDYFDQELGDNRYPAVQFVTRTNPVFSKWHGLFYEGRRKVVPSGLFDLLTPLALAIWLMDDGGADFAGLNLQTHNFELEEIERLGVVLAKRFGLGSTTRANKGRWIIYIPASQVGTLRSLVEPHILPELRYKLVPRRERTP